MQSTLGLIGSRRAGGAHERSLVICLIEKPGRASVMALQGGIESLGGLLKVRLLSCLFCGRLPLHRYCTLLRELAAFFVFATPVTVRFSLCLEEEWCESFSHVSWCSLDGGEHLVQHKDFLLGESVDIW